MTVRSRGFGLCFHTGRTFGLKVFEEIGAGPEFRIARSDLDKIIHARRARAFTRYVFYSVYVRIVADRQNNECQHSKIAVTGDIRISRYFSDSLTVAISTVGLVVCSSM